jgi:hypothetical protein
MTREEFETEYAALSTEELVDFVMASQKRSALERELAGRLSAAEAAIAAALALYADP